jgi:hypothetical protein
VCGKNGLRLVALVMAFNSSRSPLAATVAMGLSALTYLRCVLCSTIVLPFFSCL